MMPYIASAILAAAQMQSQMNVQTNATHTITVTELTADDIRAIAEAHHEKPVCATPATPAREPVYVTPAQYHDICSALLDPNVRLGNDGACILNGHPCAIRSAGPQSADPTGWVIHPSIRGLERIIDAITSIGIGPYASTDHPGVREHRASPGCSRPW